MPIPFLHHRSSRTSVQRGVTRGSAGRRTSEQVDADAVRRLVDAVDALVVVARLEGTLWLWNRRCEEVSWAPLDSVAGKPLWSMMRLRPAQQREAQSAFERLVSGQNQSVSFQSVWVRKDGRKTRISWTGRLVAAGTRPGFVVATGAEMTRGRKLMLESKKRSLASRPSSNCFRTRSSSTRTDP
jgi:PAS domain S-box-containing protein